MKKRILSTLAFVALSATLMAQGIEFEKGSWNEAIAKAKAENKTIYLDVYTSWCGPCKMMAKNYFPNEEVGKVYNKDFINVSIDAEKGEGLDIAKKYSVTGYPTNLFINPADEEIIYKTMGMPGNKEGFIQNATTAMMERNDTMKLADYEKMYMDNNFDEVFLKKYIQKLHRLDMNTDKQLDVYVIKFSKTDSPDSLAAFLLSENNSMNNKAFDFLVSDRKYTKNYTPKDDAYKTYIDSKMFATIEETQNKNDEESFLTALDKYKILLPTEKENYYLYKKEFYAKSKDESKQWIANTEYADMLTKKSSASFLADDKTQFDDAKESILWQIGQMNLPEEKQKEALENTLKANPRYTHLASSMASTQLNEVAWNAFEKKRNDKPLITKALTWAKKAVDLSKNDDISSQLAVKDTYAALLYANGKKDEAIKIETTILETAKKQKLDGVESFEETLQKMKDGKY